MCGSNENLLQVSEKLTDSTHVVPDGGDISQSLADQVLFIKPVNPDVHVQTTATTMKNV